MTRRRTLLAVAFLLLVAGRAEAQVQGEWELRFLFVVPANARFDQFLIFFEETIFVETPIGTIPLKFDGIELGPVFALPDREHQRPDRGPIHRLAKTADTT